MGTTTADQPDPAAHDPGPGLPFREAVKAYQRQLVRAALRKHQGKWAAAARELGLDRANLHHLAKRLGIK